jgi:exopolysaccharide production protein ExoY
MVWTFLTLGERLAAAILLAILSPLLIFSSVVLAALSRRSPLVAHLRVGQNGRPLWVLKLRTMWVGDSGVSPMFIERLSVSDIPCFKPKQKHARVTNRFAALCRRFSIDELPQLWHVVRGEMALVGPRPLTRQELETFYGAEASAFVLTAKPGLSGLWQISGRSRLSYAQRRRLDLFLVRRWSLSLYLQILATTLPRVLSGKDAW